jgi:hypothetical protein
LFLNIGDPKLNPSKPVKRREQTQPEVQTCDNSASNNIHADLEGKKKGRFQ